MEKKDTILHLLVAWLGMTSTLAWPKDCMSMVLLPTLRFTQPTMLRLSKWLLGLVAVEISWLFN